MKYILIALFLIGCASGTEEDIVDNYSYRTPMNLVDDVGPEGYDGCVPIRITDTPMSQVDFDSVFGDGGCGLVIMEPGQWIPPWDPSPIERN